MKRPLLGSILTIAAASAAFGSFVTPAKAIGLVPDQEGEIDVGVEIEDAEYLSNDLFPFIESIISEVDETTGSRSRLFIDNFTTENEYVGGVSFRTRDSGTNAEGFLFRPSEYDEETGLSEERGRLEVGTFTFNFNTLFEELTISYFDTESVDSTGAIAINGVALENPDWVPQGDNNNIFTQTFQDIESITLKLGRDTISGSGDGVNFQIAGTPATATVPEPATLGGLAIIGLALFGRRQLQKRC
ncbi:MAG: LEVG family PEP-CTERM protein [Microcoleaceae cyanobacterium]